ncbi:MAG: hypothetical protein ACR2N7_08405 [Acidimicrobiia bacterium]
MVLITLGTIAATRFFGKKNSDADDDIQGESKFTRLLFAAANSADYEDAEGLVAEDFAAYTNGYRMGYEAVDHGPQLLTDMLGYYNEHIANSFWELYDEVVDVDKHGEGMVSIRFLAKGEFGNETDQTEPKEVEMAGFLAIEGDKLANLRLVTDLTVFNSMRTAAGLPPVE